MRAAEVSFIRDCAEMAARAFHCLERKAAGDCTTIEQIFLKKITRIGSVTRI